MPSTIPYDPSLTLANVVNNKAFEYIKQMTKAQAPVDAAHMKLNSLIASRRSLEMTRTELANLNIDTSEINGAVGDLDKSIGDSAKEYAKTKIEAEKNILEIRQTTGSVKAQVETPVDYLKTEIKTIPLAADSINMDVQYFSMDTFNQDGNTFAKAISTFLAKSASTLGVNVQSQLSTAANSQVSQQLQAHKLMGTLVLSVSCTHKNASVLAPFVLNVDKGIKVWNHLFPQDKLDPTNRQNMIQLAESDDPDGPNRFSIVSGMTFGSSFVGMVHVMNTTETQVSQSLASLAGSLQAQMDVGAWFESASGGFGVNSTFSNEVKNLLSAQNITSHVTLICMGAIPSLVANDVKMGVEKFAHFDPQSSMQAISTIQNATVADQESLQRGAAAARAGQQMVALKASEVKAALSALADVDDGANKILDINSMMTALDDYLNKASEGKSGIPINYYLKDITKSMLAEMWVAKYFPGKYMPIIGDDSSPPAPGNPNAGKPTNTGDKTSQINNTGQSENANASPA